MPIWEIQAPDGTLYEVEGDVEPTEGEIESLFAPAPIEPIAEFPRPQPGATLRDVLQTPTPITEPWQGGVIRSAFPGGLQPEDLVPAVRKIGGDLAIGAPGDTHPDIIKDEEIPAVEIDQRGFMGPEGFMDRESAAQALGFKAQTAFEPGRLHSTDLAKAQEEEAPIPPPFESPLYITEQGPVYKSQLEAEKAGGAIRAPMPEEDFLGIPGEIWNRLRVSPPGRALFGLTEEERAAGVTESAHPSIMQATMPAWMALGGAGQTMGMAGKVLNQVVSAGFAADFARQAPEAWNSFQQAIRRGDYSEAGKVAVEFGFGAIFTALNVLGLHEQFKNWDHVAGQAEKTYTRQQEEKQAGDDAAPRVEARKAKIKREGPTPEDMVLFTGVDPADAGTTPERVEALAKELGLRWQRPAPKPVEPEVQKPAKPEVVKPAETAVPATTAQTPEQIATELGGVASRPVPGKVYYRFQHPKYGVINFPVNEGTPIDVVRAKLQESIDRFKAAEEPTPVEPPTPVPQAPVAPPEGVTVPRLPAPLIEVPRGKGPIESERARIVKALETLEEEGKDKKLYPKEGKEETVARLRTRLAEIEQQLLPKREASPVEKPAEPQVEPPKDIGTDIHLPEVGQPHPATSAMGDFAPELLDVANRYLHALGERDFADPQTWVDLVHSLSRQLQYPANTVTLPLSRMMRENPGEWPKIREALQEADRMVREHADKLKEHLSSLTDAKLKDAALQAYIKWTNSVQLPNEIIRDTEHPLPESVGGDAIMGGAKPIGSKPTPVEPTTTFKPGEALPEDLTVVPEPPPEGSPLDVLRLAREHFQARHKAVVDRIAAIDWDIERKSLSGDALEKLKDERFSLDIARKKLATHINTIGANIGLGRFRLEYQPYVGPKALPVPTGTEKITGRVLKAQKETLLKMVDDAIKEAPKQGTEKVTISVPGDGDFTIANTKDALKQFRDRAQEQFPETVGGLKEPKLPSGKSKNPPKAVPPKPEELPKLVRDTVSSDKSRFTINYAYADGTQIVATDGRQLLRIATDKAPGTPTLPVRINDKGKVLKVGTKEGDEAHEGRFPNWIVIQPSNPDLALGRMDTAQLFHIARQAEVLRDTSETDRSKRGNYFLKLYVNPDGSVGGRMDVKGDTFEHNVKPGAIDIGNYNTDYLLNAMEVARRLGNERVDVWVDGTSGPIVFRGKNHEHIIMPMHVDRQTDVRAKPVQVGRAEHGGMLPMGYGPLENPESLRSAYRELGAHKFRVTLENGKLTFEHEMDLGYTDSRGRQAKDYRDMGAPVPLKNWPADLGDREDVITKKLVESAEKHGYPQESIKKLVGPINAAVDEVIADRQRVLDEIQKRKGGETPVATPTPAPPAAEPTPPPQPTAPAPGGKLVPKERADAIRERMKKKLAEQQEPPEEMALEDVEPEALEARQPSARKLDPTIFSDAVQLGAYYIESGLHKFEPWASQMRADFGEVIEPYLKSIYETARTTIESPSGEAGGNLRAPGLQPGLRPPNDRIVTARSEQTRPYTEHGVPKELIPHLDPHQRHGVSLSLYSMNGRGGVLVADGTGVGKTREALAVAHFYAGIPGTKVLIITRAETIKPDWKKGTFGGSYFNDAKAMGVKVRLARDAVVNPGEIGITTYENAASVNKHTDPNTVLIWDESHSLKNRSGRGVQGDKANAKAKAVLFMSATPADKPEHIYYLTRMGIMEGKSVGQQLKDLGMTLVKMEKLVKDEQTGQMVKRVVHFWAPDQNVSEADRNQRFNALFDRMTANGAMVKREISMQGVHVQVLKVALPPEAHETLQEILHFFGADTIDDLKGLKKAVALMHLRRQQEPFKIAPTVLLAQRELAAGRQVVIFVSRVNESEVGKWVKGPGDMKIREVLMSSEGTAKQLRDALHEAGIHDIAEIHGEADQSSLEAMADFQNGKKRVVIATIESGGTGINLDDTVGNRPRSMIVVTAPFDAVGNVQAAGRIWRLKTLSGANLFYLFGDTDVDAWNADIIGSKMAHLGAVVEGQVRRLDISNPESVNTDDFHGTVKKTTPGAPGEAVALPALEWKPFTTKAGKSMFVAPATKEFWAWWKASGGSNNPLKLRVGKYQGEWQVWATSIPEAGPKPEVAPESFATDPQNGPGGEWASQMARHGTATGLPPGVPDGGPNFARELMAASHNLGTVVRSRATLRPGVLGQYVPARASIARADKIEVGDITNQATVAHEMGHDIDALLFPTIWQGGKIHSLESLASRIGHADKKVLAKELRSVSELMRGPIQGTRGYVNYRKRATELIADWFSLYAHDPVRARAMTPEWSSGFEQALRGNADAYRTIRELHSANVTPTAPPTPPTAPPTATAAGMPGGVPPRPVVITPRETVAALAAETLVKGSIRRLEAESQKARVRGENWREKVPDRMDRYDVGAFVEGIGNLEMPGDTRDAVVARMTPAKMELAKDYRFQIELQRQRINAYLKDVEQGEYLSFLHEYLPHFYANTQSASGKAAISRFIKNSPNAKQRKLPTLREAVEIGLIPITQDPTVLYELHARINWRVATNRMFLAQLKQLRTSAGEPVILPAGQNPGDWPVSNNPLIQRVYAHQTPAGMMLWRGGAAIHPDIWHAVRQILESPTKTTVAQYYDAINGFLRANAFALSAFHDITLRAASLGAHGSPVNPLRGLFRVLERDPVSGELRVFQTTRGVGKELLRDEEAVADAALHGLKFAWTESESYQHAARGAMDRLAARLKDVPFLGQSARLGKGIMDWRQKGLWRNTHDALKIMAYHDMVNKALSSAPPGTDPRVVKERLASLLNDAFGGQEWQTKFWLSPQVRMNIARFFLAPDWTLSTLRSVPFLSDAFSVTRGQAARIGGRGPAPTPTEGWKGNIGRARFWTAELAALALATIAAQWLIYRAFGNKDKGDSEWIWDNETGQNRRVDITPIMRQLPWMKPDDPTRFYMNLGKRPEEIMRWFVEPMKNIQAKLARPVMEVIRQIVGTEGEFPAEWKREHMTFAESLPYRLKSIAGQTIPFTLSGNQFALSLPYRKGMTKYKAGEAFTSAYEMIANPLLVKRLARGQFSGDLEALLDDIRDAAIRNGVDVRQVESRARASVRSNYYRQYFQAFEKNDQDKMNRAADALERLGVTQPEITRNVARREKLGAAL